MHVRARLASWFLAASLLLAPFSPIDAQLFVRGDVNEDQSISIADLTTLIGFLILDGSPAICYDTADIDDDGQLALTDAIWLISFLFGPNGASALPAPYPDPGVDPTPDSLPPCVTPAGGTYGSELPHVFFFNADDGADTGGFAVAPGQGPVWIPIRMSTPEPIEGLTISLSYDTSQLASAVLDFEEGAPIDHFADLRVGQVSTAYPGRIYGYVVMELLPPITETSFPAGEDLLIGHLVVEPSPDLPIGSSIEITFETHPPIGAEPPIRNEVVIGGEWAVYPTSQFLSAPVAAADSIFIRGDVNRDALVDITDGFALIQFLYNGISDGVTCLDACDVDDSGVLDLADAIGLLFTLFLPEETAAPAAPFPYQGVDTTPEDALPCEVLD